jgi:hypothetical protein
MSVLSDFGGSGGPKRPEECECWDVEQGLPCFACFNAEFSEPNPETPGADDDE